MGEEKEEKKPAAFDITFLDTYALLELFIEILNMQAWQHMGLRVKPGTDKVETDFKRANVAIDCIAFLIDKLESHIQDIEKNRLRGLLTDLQVNFIRLKGST